MYFLLSYMYIHRYVKVYLSFNLGPTPDRVPGIKSKWAKYKANDLFAILSLQPIVCVKVCLV